MSDQTSFTSDDGIIQVNIPKEGEREYWVQDAMRADGWEEYDIHRVTLDPAEITIEGTPKAIYWLYKWMVQGGKYWRLEGEQWDADCHAEMAEILWEALPENPPEVDIDREVKII